MAELPKTGEKIPVEKLFISKMNVRVEEKFGGEADLILTEHLGKQTQVQPFVARPEGKGFGVVIGRRRFLARKKAGARFFVVGVDVLVKSLSDEEAFDESLRENLPIFRDDLNPVARAKSLERLIKVKGISLRELSRVWRVPTSNLSEWMKILEVSMGMQELLKDGKVFYTDALNLARMDLPKETQNKLAMVAEKQGYEAFQSELGRLQSEHEKRGAPKGKYVVFRVMWNTKVPEDAEVYHRLQVLASSDHKELDEYCKNVLTEHAMGKK